MATLIYHWNFTGGDDLEVNEAIYDSESNLSAVLKSRGTVTSSGYSRGDNGITLNNNDSTNGGYYIELEGLNTVGWGGNISIEMVIQNDELTVSGGSNKKSLYFSSTTAEGELTTNGASLVARFGGGKTKFLARPDATSNVTYGSSNPPYRNVNETSNTVVEQGTEHHYIFSVEYDSSTGSSLKIYIDGDEKGENTTDLEKALTNDVRGSNIIGTNKDDSNTTYLKGVVKYLKIYQNSMSDSEATSIFNIYDTSPYLSNVINGTNMEKYNRRHTDVNTFFTNNSSITSFSIFGNQLGLSNDSETYTVHKFTSGSTITMNDSFNYIPIQGENDYIILKHNTKYFRITQTSSSSNENSKYKCELSEGNADNFSEVCSKQEFGDTYTNGNITIVFGGVEFNVSNEICFHEDTIIETDQGEIKIKDLKSDNTIGNTSVLYLVKSEKKHRELVLVKKDALGKNKPNKDVKITKNHLILLKDGVFPISKLINDSSIVEVGNDSDVYNIILLNNNFIKVSNIFLNVFGIDEDYLKKLENKKRDGVEEYEISFSSESKIKLDLSNLRNF